jgi:hypothetical protein
VELPSWEKKGMMVLPVKSYSSNRVYRIIGRVYHQMG